MEFLWSVDHYSKFTPLAHLKERKSSYNYTSKNQSTNQHGKYKQELERYSQKGEEDGFKKKKII